VSLVRTLTESFGSASDLYRKLKQKPRADSRSDHDDNGRREREKPRRKPLRSRRDSSSDSDQQRDRPRHVSWNLDFRKDGYSDSDDELIFTSSSQVLAEYHRGYRKIGEGFARGDCMLH
jgi:hypothetical protein